MAIFARAPSPGKTKTRLIPLIGARGAAQLQAALITDALAKVRALKRGASPYLFLAGRCSVEAAGFTILYQRGSDLGERLENAFQKLLRNHSAAVIIGTDSPLLQLTAVRLAFDELRTCDAVLGPCRDGGYYLIGLRSSAAGVFRSVRWSTSYAMRDTVRNLLGKGFSCSLIKPLDDLDVPADLRRLSIRLSRDVFARQRCPATWSFISRFFKSKSGSVPRR